MPDLAPGQPMAATTSAAPARLSALKTSRFKVPGEGNSAVISVVTVLALFGLWFVITQMGWVKPLFLPKPQAVFEQFME